VNGTTTTVNTTDLLVQDNIIMSNATPATVGKDGGYMVHRHMSDVVQDAGYTQTTINANVSSGTTVVINDDTVDYVGSVIQLFEGANTDNFEITATTRATPASGKQTVTVSTTIVHAFTTASCVVKLWTRSKAALFYDEAANEWGLVETNTKHDDANIRVKNYSQLHVGSLIVGNGVVASSADVSLNLTANSSTPTSIPQTATKGSYLVIVSCATDDRASATFFISKGQISGTASIFRMTSSASTLGEEVNISWAASSVPSLYHDSIRVSGTLTESITYKVKFITTG